jgi:hypothetical protein
MYIYATVCYLILLFDCRPLTAFRPTSDIVGGIYRATEGKASGLRGIDDDGDGRIDGDWLNGHDDYFDGWRARQARAGQEMVYSK